MHQPETLIQEEKETSIFTEAFDYAPLQKTLRAGRNWLYVIAAIQLIMGIVEYSTAESSYIGWLAFGIDSFIGLVFLVLALWSRKKPKIAFTTALAFYGLVQVIFLSFDPSNVFRGILLKILVVIALVKAVRDARKYEEIRASLGEEV